MADKREVRVDELENVVGGLVENMIPPCAGFRRGGDEQIVNVMPVETNPILANTKAELEKPDSAKERVI